jgi:hypothetical protein
MDLKKFRLRDAVEILLEPNQRVFLKTWALARLSAWICLDQRRRTRNRIAGRSSRASRQRRDAKLAGHLALATLLERRFKPGQFDKDDETLWAVLSLFLTTGSFGLFLESPRGTRGWLSRVRRSTAQLEYVYKIVEYLCRYQQADMDERKLTIECAKLFIEATDKRLTRRTLGKYWETNKQAAPYIFAFYQFCVSAVDQATSFNQFVELLEQLANNQGRLEQLLGQAAHTADILVKVRVRNVRVRDFEKVERVEPEIAAFYADEIKIIDNIDPHKLSEKEAQSYRPKSISRSRAVT